LTEIPFTDVPFCPYCGEELRGKSEQHMVWTGSEKDLQEFLNDIKSKTSNRIIVEEQIDAASFIVRTDKGVVLFVVHKPQTPTKKFFGLSEKKENKNLGCTIEVISSVPYPKEEERWKIYGGPLCSILNRYFDEATVEYYYYPAELARKERFSGKLGKLDVTCFGPKFAYKKSEEWLFLGNLFQRISTEVEAFFRSMGITAFVKRFYFPTDSSLKDFAMKRIKKAIDAEVGDAKERRKKK